MIGLSLASLLEVLSIGAIYPFLQKLITKSDENVYVGYANYSVQSLSLLFCVLIIFSALFRIFISKLQCKVGFGIGEEIADRVYKNILYSKYEEYEKIGIDNFVTSILKKTDIISQQYIIPYLNLYVNSLICIGIAVVLICVNLSLFIGIFLFVGICYVMISIINREKIINSGKIVSRCLTELNQILNITFEGYIENKIYQNEKFFQNRFEKINKELNNSLRKIDFLRIYPRYLIESLGVIFLCLMGYLMILNGDEIGVVLPILGTVAFCAQRLIPSAQQIYYSWSAIKSSKFVVNEIIEYLNIPKETQSDQYIFSNNFDKLQFQNVSFKYKGESIFILKDIDFIFNKKDKIGLIGESGSGKSTFLKMFIGILEPVNGNISINNSMSLTSNQRFLWKRISYISQKLTIIPGTILDNIAPGVEISEVELGKVKQAAQSAKISDFINELPHQYLTRIGGTGFLPSQGQIQRIILARALYRDPEILILDEFTSALDPITESRIISEILELFKDKSILMVSHKAPTLQLCDRIYEVNGGSVGLINDK
jgi:ABC-type multidrug transport system fused ATPase/permease subunit